MKTIIRNLLILFQLSLFITNVSNAQDQDILVNRIHILTEQTPGAVIIIPSEIQGRHGLIVQPNFTYLTGLDDGNSCLIITSDTSIIYTENWRLIRNGHSIFGVKEKNDLKKDFRKISNAYNNVYASFSAFDQLAEWTGSGINMSLKKEIKNIDPIIFEMRVPKDEYELELSQKAIDVTSEALIEAYKVARPGMTERELQSMGLYIVERNNCVQRYIQVASGESGTHIHWNPTDKVMEDGELITFDWCAIYKGYISDISRTIPVNGKFTNKQKDIYDLVLASQKAGIDALGDNVNYSDMIKTVNDVLAKGLVKLGLMTDENSEWQREMYFLYPWAHYTGLEIHDMFPYCFRQYQNNEWILKEGAIITMEPGLYFPEGYLDKIPNRIKGMVTEDEFDTFRKKIKDAYKKYANIGVRIEDDILIHKDENIILSSKVPKEIKDIEALMKQESDFSKVIK